MLTDALTDTEIDRLRDALVTADYTAEGVLGRLSTVASAGLGRGERTAAMLDLDGDDRPLATLIRLFLLGTAEPAGRVAAALGGLNPDRAAAVGLVAAADEPGNVRAALDLRPYGDPATPWYVVSDLGTGPGRAAGPVSADHVLGVGGASVTLASATPRRPVGSALDVGTGCGVQALHLGTHAAEVTATDRNPRALALARLTARLSAAGEWRLLDGDLLDPVAGHRFDLVVSNPPFVVGPSARYTYRDSGLPGDEVCRRLIAGIPQHLTEGGVAVLLANWLHRDGEPWTERVAGWLAGTGCDALAVQRETQDPAEYAELWLRDSGELGTSGYEDRYAEWLRWFAEHGVAAVGFGVVLLRRAPAGSVPTVRLEHVGHPLAQPLGDVFAGWLDRVSWLRERSDRALLATPLRLPDDVRLEQRAARGEEGWEVVDQALVRAGGLAPRGAVDGFGAALLAGCDGATPLGTLVDLLATGYGLSAADVTGDVLTAVRRLVEEGFLLPGPVPTS